MLAPVDVQERTSQPTGRETPPRARPVSWSWLALAVRVMVISCPTVTKAGCTTEPSTMVQPERARAKSTMTVTGIQNGFFIARSFLRTLGWFRVATSAVYQVAGGESRGQWYYCRVDSFL